MGNTFGHLFRVTTFGESHGGGVGVVVDGCPPRIPIREDEIQYELDRRKPGQSEIVTPRKEPDKVKILSGVFEGKTLGTPICMLVQNEDARPSAYSEIAEKFRPSHADYTYFIKYGIRNWQGGGRSSARETIGRVAAGAIAKKILKEKYGIEILAYVQQIYKIKANIDKTKITLSDVESNIVRCPDQTTAKEMESLIKNLRSKGDSVGGIIECIARNVPPGLGDPVFDKLQADLAKAMLSIPAAKGFDYGSGFECVNYTGTEHNDPFRIKNGKVITKTNFSGGIQGGISNGELIYFRVAFKPVATVMKEQETIDISFNETTLKASGRHDPCVLPRAVPVVESMCALVLIDHAMRHESQCK